MSKFTNPLNNIKIASPCSQDWNEMLGNERRRFCGECRLNVYNLSGMSQREAENLLLDSGGRLCVRFYRRADGSILTEDCPVGWQAIKQRVSKTTAAFVSLVFAALSGIGMANYFAKSNDGIAVEVVPKIEISTTSEITNEETDSNFVVQGKPIITVGRISAEDIPIAGMPVNIGQIKREIRKNRRR